MSAEIICVGSELLLGDILNSNAQFLAQELARLGIPHYYQTTVGDNLKRLKAAIGIACQRASLLIFTGGLGPTPDDLTTEAIADYFNVPLAERPEIVADIAQKFARRGREMTANNRKQALLPEGASILANPSGTAPGLIWQPRPSLTLLTFPGVPAEMKRMWWETAVPFLKSQGWGREIVCSRLLRFCGIGESALAEKLEGFFQLTHPTVAPYASLGEVRLRLTARASSEAEALASIEPVARQIRDTMGIDYLGADGDTLPSVVGQLLREARQTVSVAESCTGGGLGAALTTVPGSSDYFQGGIIAYDNSVKIHCLGVEAGELNRYGAVSGAIARQMALGVKKRLRSSWGLSLTGIAGPTGGTPDKPVGLVYVGLAPPEGPAVEFECRFGSERDRESIRYLSACRAMDLLRRQLLSCSISQLLTPNS